MSTTSIVDVTPRPPARAGRGPSPKPATHKFGLPRLAQINTPRPFTRKESEYGELVSSMIDKHMNHQPNIDPMVTRQQVIDAIRLHDKLKYQGLIFGHPTVEYIRAATNGGIVEVARLLADMVHDRDIVIDYNDTQKLIFYRILE